MKVLLRDVVLIPTGLVNTLMQKDLPIKASYWFSRLATIIDKELKIFEQSRSDMFKKYGEPVENSEQAGTMKIKDEYMDQCNKEFQELLEQEIDINFNPIKLSLFSKVDVKPIEILPLLPFLFDDEEEIL